MKDNHRITAAEALKAFDSMSTMVIPAAMEFVPSVKSRGNLIRAYLTQQVRAEKEKADAS